MKILNDQIGNRTRVLPACSTPRTRQLILVLIVLVLLEVVVVAAMGVAAVAAETSKRVQQAMYKRPRNLCYNFSYFRIKADGFFNL